LSSGENALLIMNNLIDVATPPIVIFSAEVRFLNLYCMNKKDG